MTQHDRANLPTAPHPPPVVRTPITAELGPGAVLADRYEIRSRLGAGGMGAVWRALDRALEEEVAVKVLLADWSRDPGMIDRFRRELKLARKISHPNVCRVFDQGEADGLRFLTMELVEGQTLRAILADGAIEPKRALSLLQQVASGLAAVHAQGIIHRDLKPENVLVRRDGQAIVADFGLARGALAQTSTVNTVAGTPGYMSPEQLRGEPLDVTSDIFALGLLGFELLTGRSPFGEGTPATVVSAILRDPPRPLVVPALPDSAGRALDALLARAMEKRPEARFPSAGSFGAALAKVVADLSGMSDASADTEEVRPADPPPPQAPPTLPPPPSPPTLPSPPVLARRRAAVIAAVASASLVVALVAVAWRAGTSEDSAPLPVNPPREEVISPGPTAPEDSRPSLVVMPFENLTGEAAWDGLRQGAREAILGGLRTMPQIRALDSGPSGDPGAEATRRGAVWTVTGTVQRMGEGLRLAAQLRASGAPVASEPVEVDGDPGGLPRLLEALRQRTLDEVRLLWRDHERLGRAVRGTRDAAAQAKLLRYYGMIGPAPHPQHYAEGKRLLDEALAGDADYVPALAERAYLQALHAYAESDPSLYAPALVDLDRALARAAEDPQALVMRCRVLQVRRQTQEHVTDADNEAAFDACEAARHADPGSAAVLLVFARLYEDTCKNDLASEVAEQAIELDRSLSGRVLMPRVMLALQDDPWEVADRLSLKLVAFDDEQRAFGARGISRRMGVLPEPGAHLLRAAVLLRGDRLDEARRELSEELAINAAAKADGLFEAASIRGLLRVAREKGEPAKAELKARLAVLERQYREGAAKNPHLALAVTGAYQWIDPEAAVAWIGRGGAPGSFMDAFHRALVYRTAGRPAAARAALETRAPTERWEQACASWLRARLSP